MSLRKLLMYILFHLLITFWFLLGFSTLTAHADVIIDNGNPGTSYTGNWAVSGGTTPYGTNSLWARDGAKYTWQMSSQPAGVYEVYMWWSGWPSRATNIAVAITHRDGVQTVNINQQNAPGTWNKLGGQYYFNTTGKVTITAANGSSVSTCADAVWFKLITANAPPVAYIDSITPNPATPGQTVTFTGHGTDNGSVTAYEWVSSINGVIGTTASFPKSDLSTGTHTITFRVKDNADVWSDPVTQILVVGSASTEVIIDNRDAATSKTGTWGVSGATNFWGVDSVWARNGATFSWIFTPPQSGNYEVSMWWTQYSSRSNNIAVDIENSGVTARVYINQQQNGGKWNVLGGSPGTTYPFTTGRTYRVTITAANGSSVSTCADAVKFVYVPSGNVPPEATIVSISPNPSLPEEEVIFTGEGADSDGDVTAYSWRSSENGFLSDSAIFSTSSLFEPLSEGIHIIYFKVQDDDGAWSPEVSMVIGHLGCGSPIRIMPLGDSITYGTGEISSSELVTGYRQPLYLSLTDAGHYVDFVGSRKTGQSATPLFDYDHEGHGGWRDDEVADYIYQWLVNDPADVILLHIGTNALDPSPSDVEDILDEIDRYSEDITVVLARIINRQTYSATTTQFNDNVQAMAESRVAEGDTIIIIDQESALNYSTDMWDNLHPNNSGYNKMASVWFDALHDLLPACEQVPPSIISATAGSGGSITPSGAVPVRHEADQSFVITPNTGFHIVDVLVDEGSEGAITSYTFPSVISNHTIEAFFAPDILQETIIDNRDAATSRTGTWKVSGAIDPWEADSFWSRDGTTFTWIFTPSQTGSYELYMWWTQYSSRSNNIAVDVEYSGDTERVYINQQQDGGKWNLLGTYPFVSGVTYRVTITAATGSTVSTCADAVKFVLLP